MEEWAGRSGRIIFHCMYVCMKSVSLCLLCPMKALFWVGTPPPLYYKVSPCSFCQLSDSLQSLVMIWLLFLSVATGLHFGLLADIAIQPAL